jgi:hypothetical protein
MNKKQLKKVNRVRKTILIYLNQTAWPWEPHFSNLLDQMDSRLFGMRQNLD